MLKSLHLRNVGPAKQFDLEFGKRLNVLTGDNGLGKSLLLDVAWWACTNTWPSLPAVPAQFIDGAGVDYQGKIESEMRAEISDNLSSNRASLFNYETSAGEWRVSDNFAKHLPSYDAEAVKIYSRLDGGFCISDPFRRLKLSDLGREIAHRVMGANLQLSKSELWDGKSYIDKSIERSVKQCNGLLSDWLNWEVRDRKFFDVLAEVLANLSPPDEAIVPANVAVRLPGYDVSDIPAIKTHYGIIPITHASAGVQRILGLAYAIVWAIRERAIISNLRGVDSNGFLSVLIVIDEIESHLHPKWQRVLLPALLSIGEKLGNIIDIQFIVSTHSPLVLASLETEFDAERDRLFHLKLDKGEVTLQQEEWTRRGDVSRWLTSDIFDLGEARSLEAEAAISVATGIMRVDMSKPPNLEDLKAADAALRRTLPSMDPVWARWSAFKSRLADRGVTI